MTPEELNQLAADDPGIVALYDQVCAEARDMDPIRVRAFAAVLADCQPTRNPAYLLLRSPRGGQLLPRHMLPTLADAIADRVRHPHPTETKEN